MQFLGDMEWKKLGVQRGVMKKKFEDIAKEVMEKHKKLFEKLREYEVQERKDKMREISMKLAEKLVKEEYPNEVDAYKYHLYVFRSGAQRAAYEILENIEKYAQELYGSDKG